MLKVGLTGGIGSGKSTVARIFELLGIPVFVADLRAHMLMTRDQLVKDRIISLLGPDSYDTSGRPDRKYISSKVFDNKKLLDGLNAIVHPAVRDDFESWCQSFTQHPYVIQEAAVLFESGGAALMEENILVWAPEAQRIDRVIARDHVSKSDVLARMHHQWSEDQKVYGSQFVIINDTTHSLIRQVLDIDAALVHIGTTSV